MKISKVRNKVSITFCFQKYLFTVSDCVCDCFLRCSSLFDVNGSIENCHM